MSRGKAIFSGEPLPIPPKVSDPEVDAFHRKLIDYLRRLAAKLGRVIDLPPEGGVGAVPTMAAIKSMDQSLTGGMAWDQVLWETLLWEDAPFTLEVDTVTVTINEAGRFVVYLDLSFFKPLDIHARLVLNGTQVDHSFIYSYNGTADGYSMSGSIPLELEQGDELVVEVAGNLPDIITTGGCRLTIFKVDPEEEE